VKNELLISLGQRIRELRLQKGWSQEKFASISGFHRTYIGMVERGERNISIINLKILSDAFSIELHELIKLD